MAAVLPAFDLAELAVFFDAEEVLAPPRADEPLEAEDLPEDLVAPRLLPLDDPFEEVFPLFEAAFEELRFACEPVLPPLRPDLAAPDFDEAFELEPVELPRPPADLDAALEVPRPEAFFAPVLDALLRPDDLLAPDLEAVFEPVLRPVVPPRPEDFDEPLVADFEARFDEDLVAPFDVDFDAVLLPLAVPFEELFEAGRPPELLPAVFFAAAFFVAFAMF
ncbi:MAG: hypothetical protein WKF70_10855 [Chitinophagaceae bacterium]